jgi:hypothetical protein
MATKKEQKAAEVLANRRAAFEKKVRALLGHVSGRVKRAELDAAFAKVEGTEYGPAADALAAEIASREPVGRAVHDQKADAVKYAEEEARRIVARVEKELADAGWDRQAYAPYPMRIHAGTRDYGAKAKYSLVQQLTTHAEGTYRSLSFGEPDPVVMDPEGVERFVDGARRDAALQYDAFICKMVAKVGPCDDAELDGSHVWGSSYLTVKKGAASEVWHTQQIANQTKYGRPYLQWPSRLMKGGK